jgi:cyclopropane-fatty-acyl-phospholipid synthase
MAAHLGTSAGPPSLDTAQTSTPPPPGSRDQAAQTVTGERGAQPASIGPAGRLERWAIEALRRRLGGVPVRLTLWNGFDVALGADPVATVRIGSRRALVDLVRNADLQFGEHFMAGDLEIEGDLVALLRVVFERVPSRNGGRETHHANPLRAARDNVHHHYDLGNDFYRLWLDDNLVYTCAYFPSPDATLEQAQAAKMDLVCRKLALRPGERVIEAGCGWGALALHMAREYGVTVKAFNISREQMTCARERAAREGLSSRVTFVEEDYRAIRETADVFVSVGMLEHVGPADYPQLAGVIRRVLGDGRGRGLLHFIGRSRPAPINAWIGKRIFPGAYPPTLPEALQGVLEPEGYAVLDVENLRLHYALTLDHWRRRYLAALETVERMFDERFARAWLLYLSGSQAAFLSGALQLFQVVFAPAGAGVLQCERRA